MGLCVPMVFISLHHRFRVCVFIHFTLTTVPCGVAGVTGVLFPHSSTETWVQTDVWLELGGQDFGLQV